MGSRFRTLSLAVIFGAAGLSGAGAQELDAKAHNDRAVAAFALGQYAEAAQEYEAAFKQRPLPELLYNAAQAHRIAGDKARALLLYQNYLRVFGARVTNREEVEGHIAALQRAVDSEAKAATSPPTTTVVAPVQGGGRRGRGAPPPRPARALPLPEARPPSAPRPSPRPAGRHRGERR